MRRNSSRIYALDEQGSDVEAHAGHTVEVTGTLEQPRVLKVETLRPVAASCTP